MESMAAVLNGQPGDVTTVLQYEDDSVEARYSDGARISLSACGAALARRESGKSTSGADERSSRMQSIGQAKSSSTLLCQIIEPVTFARCVFMFALRNIALGGYLDTRT